MNTATATATEPEERSILCDQELIRLIKKLRRVCVHVRSYEGKSSASVQCVAKDAIDGVQRGDFEGFVAKTHGRTVWLNSEEAPLWLQMRRTIARLTKRIAWAEQRIAEIQSDPDAMGPYRTSMLAMHHRDVESDRRTVAHAQAFLARRAQPAAA